MPDTGSPWNIPYVEAADLVRDWPADSLLVANAVAAGLTAANVGIGSNVVQAVKTDTFTTSSTSYVPVTGLSVSITPSTATSKVLVIVSVFASNTSTADNSLFRLYRGATSINEGASGYTAYVRETNDVQLTHWGAVYLDSPASAASTTYSIQGAASDGTLTVNRRGATAGGAGVSSITVIEVAA